jgi:hypothetical protein
MSVELTAKEIKMSKPMNATQFDITPNRKVVHKQYIVVPNKASFEVELSWCKIKFYIIIKRKLEK